MPDETRIAVVIPTYDGRGMLRDYCEALRRQEFRDFRVRVVHNASTDGTREMLRREFPEVGLLRLPRNRGFAGAVNAGIRAGDEPYVALLNNDAMPEPEWLGELVRRAESASGESFWASVLLREPGALLTAKRHVIQSAGLSIRRDGTPVRLAEGRGVRSLNCASLRSILLTLSGNHSPNHLRRQS